MRPGGYVGCEGILEAAAHPDHVERLRAAPNEHLATLEGSKRCQLALLELRLGRHGI